MRGHHPDGHRHGEYLRAKVAEDDHAQREREHAARTVACNARSVQDLRLLLSILGLDASDQAVERDTDPWRGSVRR
jgi:hypothetical protein